MYTLLHAEHYLVFADDLRRLPMVLFALALVFLQHVVDLSHVFVSDLLLIRLSFETAYTHLTLGQRKILVHLHFDSVYVELLSVVLYFLALVGNRVGPFDLLLLHRSQGIL